ncbi:MAG TPA: NAD(P)H-dependent oxidoreductase subunit E [Nitrospinota bacterium]|nr:NAD(P)H-dependent oxidoreductase subunit E [Nitrospinota bacterium]|tara:strand:- start:25162 stop:25674 length:513 start_codon:yes stop_codon:yes gene_type:complete
MNDLSSAVNNTADNQINIDHVNEILDSNKDFRGGAIPVLQKIQIKYGYLPKESLYLVSKRLRIPLAHLVGVASFYAQFRMSPRGKYMIKICCGTACHVKGSIKLVDRALENLEIEAGETSTDNLFTVERVACIGACSLAPAITLNDVAAGHLNADQLEKIIADLKADGLS